jgi:hypothetical protein
LIVLVFGFWIVKRESPTDWTNNLHLERGNEEAERPDDGGVD